MTPNQERQTRKNVSAGRMTHAEAHAAMNTKPMHTPGPWYLYPVTTAGGMKRTTVIADDPGEPIALIANEYRTARKADACLIAAAPALSEALAELVAWIDDNVRTGTTIDALGKARAALKEARL